MIVSGPKGREWQVEQSGYCAGRNYCCFPSNVLYELVGPIPFHNSPFSPVLNTR